MWTKLIHRNEIWKNLNNEEQKLDLSECNCKTDQRGGEGTRGGEGERKQEISMCVRFSSLRPA